MEAEGSFPHLQQSVTCPYPQSDEYSKSILIYLIEDIPLCLY